MVKTEKDTLIISGSRQIEGERLAEHAAKAASGFASLGIGEGDAIAVLLRNDFSFFTVARAASLLGAYVVPINWHYVGDEVNVILQDCQAKALVIHSDLWQGLAETLNGGLPTFQVPTSPEIAAAYDIHRKDGKPSKDAVQFQKWLGRFPVWQEPAKPPRGNMIYTSGTTGSPKGVRRAAMDEAQIAASAVLRKQVFGLSPDQEIRTVMTGPVYHSAPNAYALLCDRYGGEIVLQPRFDAEGLLGLIESHRISHLHMVPTMFVRLLALPDEVRDRYDVSSLRFVVHAAAPCPAEVKQQMINWWGPVINEYYGGTESGPICFHDSAAALRKPGTVGQPVPAATVKIISLEGTELPTGEVGLIYSRLADYPDFVYHGNATARGDIEVDGLITLGDMGYLDQDGFLFVTDRLKDMVISGGVNIYPAEIEAQLISMKGVRDCAVFGIPDGEFGEKLMAVIEPDPRFEIDEKGVKRWLRQRLSGYKIPREIIFQDGLPREDSGKIFKRKLRDPYWQAANRQI